MGVRKSFKILLIWSTFSPRSVVHTPCCTTPNSPSPRDLLMWMASAGMICRPGDTMYDVGRDLCSGGEGLRVRPGPSDRVRIA